MSVHTCSLCNRPAAWQVGKEPMCELHKEQTIERFGVDRFSIQRFAEDESRFQIRGRYKNNPRIKLPTRKRTVHPN